MEEVKQELKQSGPFQVPYHKHTGTDSPQIEAADILGGSGGTVACRAYRTAAQTLATGNSVKIGLDTANWDTDTMLGSSKITVPKAGYYSIQAQVMFNSAEAGKLYSAWIDHNGVQVANTTIHANATNGIVARTTDIRYMASGDYLELYCYHNTSTNVALYTGSVGTYISIAKI